jgi:hypothetical protein
VTVIPKLLNPTVVEIEQKDETKTRYDHRRRTTTNYVARGQKFQLNAQVKWSMSDAGSRPEISQGGVDEQTFGYFICRQLDLNTLGKELKRGDKVVSIGGKEVTFYILRVEYGSHYGGDFSLLKVIFTDRAGQDG